MTDPSTPDPVLAAPADPEPVAEPLPEAPAPPPQLTAVEIASAAVQSAVPAPEPDSDSPISLLEEGERAAYSDAERLAASPLEEWFPGVTWKVLLSWLGGTCYQSEDETITLIVESGGHTSAGNVRYTRRGPWERGVIGYWGPVVTSITEIGELVAEDAAASS